MTEDGKSRKRAWGKTKHRGKGPPVAETESMECNDASAVKRIKLNDDTSRESSSKIDLQHPELMSNTTLVSLLSEYKVPIPVYADGTPSRERLMYLARKHITPQPQRPRWHALHEYILH